VIGTCEKTEGLKMKQNTKTNAEVRADQPSWTYDITTRVGQSAPVSRALVCAGDSEAIERAGEIARKAGAKLVMVAPVAPGGFTSDPPIMEEQPTESAPVKLGIDHNTGKWTAAQYVIDAGWDSVCVEATAKLGVAACDANGLTSEQQSALLSFCIERQRKDEAA
jgi:hypothetical protein